MLNNAKKIRQINRADFFNLGNFTEKIKFLLRYAILAPSTHNIQPWKFSIKEKSCLCFVDKKLYLPYGDPKTQNSYISLGGTIENLILVAKYYNFFDHLDYNYDKSGTFFVEVFFKEGVGMDENFTSFEETIKNRVNVRGVFEEKDIGLSVLDELLDELTKAKSVFGVDAYLITDKNKIKEIAKLTAKGMQTAHSNKDFRKEMSLYINNNLSSRKYGIHGFSMKAPLLFSFILPSVIKWFDMGKILGKLNFKSISSAPLICVLSGGDDTPVAWTKVGRLAQHLTLISQNHNLRTSIYVAAIEMGYENELMKIIGADKKPHFLFCVGYMKSKARITPRLEVENKLTR